MMETFRKRGTLMSAASYDIAVASARKAGDNVYGLLLVQEAAVKRLMVTRDTLATGFNVPRPCSICVEAHATSET